jgi:hypothetical protein
MNNKNIQELLLHAVINAQAAQERVVAFEKQIAEAKRLMGEKEAGPWVPRFRETFFYVYHDGAQWTVLSDVCGSVSSAKVIEAKNYHRFLEGAQEIATQRNFITERVSAGDLAPDRLGWDFFINDNGLYLTVGKRKGEVQRTFSTPELRAAFIEKWGGESEVARRLAKGWV